MSNVAYKVGRDVYITSRLSPLVDLALNKLHSSNEELIVFLQLSFMFSHIVPPTLLSRTETSRTNKPRFFMLQKKRFFPVKRTVEKF